MTTDHPTRKTIIGVVGLSGASAGIVLGFIEAGCLRFTDLPPLMPHVRPSFWFFAPLLTSVIFGLLGLLAGFLATLLKPRFFGTAIIAGLSGLAGVYLALALRFSLSTVGWYIALQRFVTPRIMFAGFFIWTFLALWDTRKPDSPLGFLAIVPRRIWSGVVLGLIAVLTVGVGIHHLPNHLNFSTTHTKGGDPQSPNIVLIVWDTARADHFSSYGYSRNTTPNVDRLARRGIVFENAISASSWTLPSTYSMFTSLLPHQHGSGTERESEARTLAEILAAGGYETAGFNANPYCGIANTGVGRGFKAYIDSTRSMGYSFTATRIGGEFVEPYSEKWFQRSRFNQFTAHQLNEEIYRWYDRPHADPFFLYVNYNDAHDPYEVPSPYDHFYGQVSTDAKHLLLTAKSNHITLSQNEREGVIAAYDNALRYIDSQAGELLQFLEHSSEGSNTYVIVTADHGEGFGEHRTYSHGWNLNREVLHVPLIVVGPGVPAGVRVTDVAATRQIFSTVLEFAGLKRAILRHSSLSRYWDPGNVAADPDEPSISELVVMRVESLGVGKSDNIQFPMPRGSVAMTTGEWQLICEGGGRQNQLYHWPTDPLEQWNVADSPGNQALLEHLKERLLLKVKTSYRPWRDTDYLEAVSGADLSQTLEALQSSPGLIGSPVFPLGLGAEQSLFAPNWRGGKKPDKELLMSLPYGGM